MAGNRRAVAGRFLETNRVGRIVLKIHAVGVASVALIAISGCAGVDPWNTTNSMPVAPSAYYEAATPLPGEMPIRTPEPEPEALSKPLTLADCIRFALIRNPDVGAAVADVEAAAAQTDVAAGARWPSVRGVGGYSRYQDDQRLSPATRNGGEPGLFTKDIFNADLVLSLPLYAGGRITNEIRASELLRRSAEHRIARTREELVFNVSSVFYNILGQRHVIESLQFSRKALEEQRKRVADLMEAQKAAKVDLLRTEVRLADLDQRLARERNVLAIQDRVLLNLMGVEDPLERLDVQGELAFGEVEFSLEEKLSSAQARRSDYLSAQAAYDAQARRVDVARGGHWPTVSLRGSYGGRWAGHASDAPAGTDRFDVGTVGVFLEIPLFEGGRVSAQVRQEQARLRAAQERLRKLELQVRLDVESAALNIASARQRIAATEKSVEQAKESLRIEQEKYALGKGSITDVLDAESALLEAQTSYYRALADYHTAIAQLRLAPGEKS